MAISDFEKMEHNPIEHVAFEALDQFQVEYKRLPEPWNLDDATKFVGLGKKIAERYNLSPNEWKQDGIELKLLHLFAFQCRGTFNPICAFFGGFVAQEVVKAITGKFTPTNQVFYYDAIEVLPDFDATKDL
jgi:ubiquitin-activating enzyme E1